MQSMNDRDRSAPDSSLHLLVILGPVLGLLTCTAVLAGVAALFGWHPTEMAATAGVTGGTVVAVAMYLAFRQARERQAADRALENIEARVAGIVESAMDAIITVDDRQRIILFNSAAEKVFRWPRTAVIGQPLDMLIPARFRAGHDAHVRRFGQTGVTSRRMGDQTVLWGLRADGQEFPIEASISQHLEDNKRLFTVILRDISERLKADEELSRSEARLRGILDSAMDAIITVDESQKIVLFNKAAEDVFGCPRAEAIGAPLAWFIPERFRAGHDRHVRQFGETGTTSRRMGAQRIVTGLRRNGEEFPIDASISQISENDSKYYTVILRDVTERVKGEEALKRSQEELRELASASNSVREQEKSRIARELHDELGQALTALKMDVQWLAEKAADQPALTQKLEGMRALLDTTVAATRRISSDLRPLMLDDLGLMPAVDWLVQNFRQRTGITVEFSAPELELQEPYATAVFRILQESLTNVARHSQATLVEIQMAGSEREVTLRVRDNGVGFQKEAPQKRGSFGLMGVAERAYLLGGEVDVRSERNHGTSIEVRIPLARETEHAA